MSETTGTRDEPRPEDGASVGRLGLVHIALVAGALSLWAAADAWYAATGLGLATLLCLVDGVLVGGFVAGIAHEWGHFAGARLFGGVAPTISSAFSVFPIFKLDMEQSSDDAFKAMSIGGNAAHWLVVILLAALLPLDAPARIALVAGAFGFAVFASTTEVPVIRSSFAGAAPRQAMSALDVTKLKRNAWIGAGAGLALLALL